MHSFMPGRKAFCRDESLSLLAVRNVVRYSARSKWLVFPMQPESAILLKVKGTDVAIILLIISTTDSWVFLFVPYREFETCFELKVVYL